jgi:hypothetical protein
MSYFIVLPPQDNAVILTVDLTSNIELPAPNYTITEASNETTTFTAENCLGKWLRS